MKVVSYPSIRSGMEFVIRLPRWGEFRKIIMADDLDNLEMTERLAIAVIRTAFDDFTDEEAEQIFTDEMFSLATDVTALLEEFKDFGSSRRV